MGFRRNPLLPDQPGLHEFIHALLRMKAHAIEGGILPDRNSRSTIWKSSSAFSIHSLTVAFIENLPMIKGHANEGISFAISALGILRSSGQQIDGKSRIYCVEDSRDFRKPFPSIGRMTRISTSESSSGTPYAWELKRMIFSGLNCSATLLPDFRQ